MAQHIKTTGEIVEVEPKNGKKFNLEELQGFVGGYIERVQLADKRDMWLNEEGKIHGLPLNMAASMLANQTIVGDVLVCGRGQA